MSSIALWFGGSKNVTEDVPFIISKEDICDLGQYLKTTDILCTVFKGDYSTALWEQTKEAAGISRKHYREYFRGHKVAHAYVLGKAPKFDTPKSISDSAFPMRCSLLHIYTNLMNLKIMHHFNCYKVCGDACVIVIFPIMCIID